STPIDMDEQAANKERIKQTLLDYGIEIQNITAMVGPTITLFEIVLVNGTKISRVKSLSDEIAMSIAAKTGIRIIAPIPGKCAIGIEVPNKDPQTVSMRECIQSRAFQESRAALPVALGKTITNEVFTFDLAKAPHMLVAGATGQGKSVGLNAIITSLLYKKHPSQLKIVLVDPKMVEFAIYSAIDKHFLAKLPDAEDPIITDTSKVVETLKSLCAEMEDRYALLKEAGCRKLEEYNDKFIHRKLNPKKHIDAPLGSKQGTHHHYLPYIVAIVDEYGDLIMTAGKEVELPIARIAQKARAVGIHMIIATQRPSAKIVTGIIKANFPARIAFRVSSQTDSSIILDQSGAQNLIGRGDLFISLGDRFERVQCAFVDTPEVVRVNEFIAQQQSYPTSYILPEPKPEPGEGSDEGGSSASVDLNQLDPLFNECAELVVATGQGSTSMIQRKFGIGYNRAGRIMDQLEAAGIVGAYQGSKARSVLITSDMELQNVLADIRNR
ncbi:MAG: DNA translocase FtsK, partial [Bacteroidales bacterium]|nr:DNA translocase FtsK [Bacteroidales bacterium]